ncbi:Solute carrier 38 member, partial [Perkinsus olseni]
LVPYLFGNAVGYWFQAPIMIFCVGAGSGYLITVTDILSSLFAAVVESDTWYGNLLTKRVYLSLLVLAVVLYPISLVRRMSSLRYLTLVSIFGIFYLGFVGVFLLATEGLSPDFTTNDITFYAPTGWVSCLGAANTFIFAFCNQCNIPDIYMEM